MIPSMSVQISPDRMNDFLICPRVLASSRFRDSPGDCQVPVFRVPVLETRPSGSQGAITCISVQFSQNKERATEVVRFSLDQRCSVKNASKILNCCAQYSPWRGLLLKVSVLPPCPGVPGVPASSWSIICPPPPSPPASPALLRVTPCHNTRTTWRHTTPAPSHQSHEEHILFNAEANFL